MCSLFCFIFALPILFYFAAVSFIGIRAFNPSLDALSSQSKQRKSPPFVCFKILYSLQLLCIIVREKKKSCLDSLFLHVKSPFPFKKFSFQRAQCCHRNLLSHTCPSTCWHLLYHSDQKKFRGAPIGIKDNFLASGETTEAGQSIAMSD